MDYENLEYDLDDLVELAYECPEGLFEHYTGIRKGEDKFAKYIGERKTNLINAIKELQAIKRVIPCPVDVLVKALTNGIYGYETSVANDTFNNLIITKMRIPKLKLDYLTHTKLVFEQDKHYVKRIYRLEDYQITWGLTKTDFVKMDENDRLKALSNAYLKG